MRLYNYCRVGSDDASGALRVSDDQRLLSIGDADGGPEEVFEFSAVLGATSSQEEVFRTCALHVCHAVVAGIDSTVVVTGSSNRERLLRGGQEYTDRGVVPQAISTVFQLIEQRKGTHDVQVAVSFPLILHEQAFDLFDTANDETASLSTWRSLPCNRLAASSGSLAEVISGLAYLEADSARTALGLFEAGSTKQSVVTASDSDSFKSHKGSSSIFTLELRTVDRSTSDLHVSRLSFVDLNCSADSAPLVGDSARMLLGQALSAWDPSMPCLERCLRAFTATDTATDNDPELNRASRLLTGELPSQLDAAPVAGSVLTAFLSDRFGARAQSSDPCVVLLTQVDLHSRSELLAACRFAQRCALPQLSASVRSQALIDAQAADALWRQHLDTMMLASQARQSVDAASQWCARVCGWFIAHGESMAQTSTNGAQYLRGKLNAVELQCQALAEPNAELQAQRTMLLQMLSEAEDPLSGIHAVQPVVNSDDIAVALATRVAELESQLKSAQMQTLEATHRQATLENMLMEHAGLNSAGAGSAKLFKDLVALRNEKESLIRQHEAQMTQMQEIMHTVNEQFQRDLADLRVTMATQESEAAARLASKEDELHTHYQTHYQTLYDEFVVTHQRNEEAAAQAAEAMDAHRAEVEATNARVLEHHEQLKQAVANHADAEVRCTELSATIESLRADIQASVAHSETIDQQTIKLHQTLLDVCQEFNQDTEDEFERSERDAENSKVSTDTAAETWASDTLASLSAALNQGISRIRYLRRRAVQLRHEGDEAARAHHQSLVERQQTHEDTLMSLTSTHLAESTRLNESLTATQHELAATRASLQEAQRSLADARTDHSQALSTAQSHWAAQLDTCAQSHAAQLKVAHDERETAIQRLTEDAKVKAERDAVVLTQAQLEIQNLTRLLGEERSTVAEKLAAAQIAAAESARIQLEHHQRVLADERQAERQRCEEHAKLTADVVEAKHRAAIMSMQQRMADAAAENERLSADQTVSLQREYGTSMETARAAAVKAQHQAVQATRDECEQRRVAEVAALTQQLHAERVSTKVTIDGLNDELRVCVSDRDALRAAATLHSAAILAAHQEATERREALERMQALAEQASATAAAELDATQKQLSAALKAADETRQWCASEIQRTNENNQTEMNLLIAKHDQRLAVMQSEHASQMAQVRRTATQSVKDAAAITAETKKSLDEALHRATRAEADIEKLKVADTAYRTETAAKWSDRDRADADRLVAHNLAEKRRQAEIDSMKADHELQLQSLKAELPAAAAAAAQALADAQALAAQQHRVEIERVRAECSAAASESIAAVMNVKNDAEARVKQLQAEVEKLSTLKAESERSHNETISQLQRDLQSADQRAAEALKQKLNEAELKAQQDLKDLETRLTQQHRVHVEDLRADFAKERTAAFEAYIAESAREAARHQAEASVRVTKAEAARQRAVDDAAAAADKARREAVEISQQVRAQMLQEFNVQLTQLAVERRVDAEEAELRYANALKDERNPAFVELKRVQAASAETLAEVRAEHNSAMQRARSEFAAALELQRDTADREKEIATRAAALASQHHEAALKSVSDRAAAELLVARAQWTAEASQLRDQAVQAAVAAARESCAREESAAMASARTFHERSLADVRAMLDVWQNECQQLRQQLNGQKGDESIVKQLEEERQQHLLMLAKVREEAAEAAENDRKRFAELSAERVRAETTLQARLEAAEAALRESAASKS